jgi:hypothetical protein
MMHIQKLICTYLSFLFSIICATEIVHLQPPKLHTDTIAYMGACDRPKRTDGPNISVEHTNHKTVVNCYGQGGVGFVTLFGSVQEAIDLLMSTNPSYDEPIRVIGSGCTGLVMAIELRHHGFTQVTISTKEIYDIPSWRAGGLFAPGTGRERDLVDQERVRRAIATYHVYHQAEQGMHPYLTSDVVEQMPIYFPNTIWMGVEILELLGYMPPHKNVTLYFGEHRVPQPFVQFTTYFMHISDIMQQLWQEVRRLEIPVTIEEILTIDSCPEHIICNCAGFAGSELTADDQSYLQRGHFFMLNPEAGDEHMHYMLFTKVSQGDAIEHIYFLPKNRLYTTDHPEGIECRGMLGGTFISHVEQLNKDELQELDKNEFLKLAQRVREFFYGKL